MAYQIKIAKNRIEEDLELVHADGSEAVTIHVSIDTGNIGKAVLKCYENVGNAQARLQSGETNANTMEAYGRAVIELFGVIFGEENTRKLLEAFDGNETEMLLGVFPFIEDVVMPAVRSTSEARKEQLLRATNSAQRFSK